MGVFNVTKVHSRRVTLTAYVPASHKPSDMAPFHAELRKLVAKHKARIQKAHAARTKKKGK